MPKIPPVGIRAVLTFSIALLVVAVGTGGAAPPEAYAATSSAFSAQVSKPPPRVWAACPSINRAAAEQKLVRRFDRAPGVVTGVVPMPAGTSDLLCGTDNFGFYHVESRHYVDWNRKSIVTNENWRDVADYSIAEALRNPTAVTFRAANITFCYSRQVSLVEKVRGIIVDVMYPMSSYGHRMAQSSPPFRREDLAEAISLADSAVTAVLRYDLGMGGSYLDRLIKSVEDEDHGLFVGRRESRLLLTEYRGDRFDPPLLFDFTEEELDAAVRELGRDGKKLWPDVAEPEGGFRLLLVHLYESLNSTTIPTRRVYVSRGQISAE